MADQEHPAAEPVVVDEGEPERPGWPRIVIIGAAMAAVLLVGATVGMLLTQSLIDEAPASPGAGSVEVGFAQDMSVHHLQAVTMANWARDHSADPEVKQLAFDILSTQTEQVGRMKGWLMLWGQPEQATGAYMTWMTAPGGHSHGGGQTQAASGGAPMPGMATTEELAKLRSLTGKAMDVYFLQLMLRHHQGGTSMAQYAKDHSPLPAVQALTQSMLVSQGAEMELMRQMLTARNAQPLQ
ncbi:DUF305 domain-containing protein [Amycolatopsis anabasis]|uniref:DUF305 domain-containing protein n=1 Tax=Amycolatopsis anabasis TaxID=1840409 RepID=UPI001FE428A2|nr:DUF305 domain-containing protein [Amycolatopsis anabasis]